jgi:transcriptional antiterminator RfaH
MLSRFLSTNLQPLTTHYWYVVHCQPFGESRAAAALEGYLGLQVYLPEVWQRVRGQVRRVAFFPRYLFVRANLYAVTTSRINATPGVLRLIAFGDIPQPVPGEIIEAIRERVDHLNDRAGLPEYLFRPGDVARLKGGPLRGLEAVFVRSMKFNTRARVLIDFLGQLSEADVEMNELEPVGVGAELETGGSQPVNTKVARVHERRTRGKGRAIGNGVTAQSGRSGD